MQDQIRTVVQVENVDDLPEYRGVDPSKDFERFKKAMETILSNNNDTEQTKELDITPIDVSQHVGIQDLIDLTNALQPVMDATQAFYVMTAPQGSQFRTTTDAWIYE